MVFATSATLGLVPPDPAIGCRIFAYDVPGGTLRQVRALPLGMPFDTPALSDDGHWLTFTTSRAFPPNISRGVGARVDVRSGVLEDSIGGVIDYPSFDAVVSGDGSAIVVSTQADLDPRVGNADHNMDLFVYDVATGRFTQMSETTEGIGRFPGGCPAYRPRVNSDARVAAFEFLVYSGEGCQLDGPQRNEIDGLMLGRVRAVRKRSGNHGPRLQPLRDVRVEAGQTLTVEFSATDPDGDPVVFFSQVVGGLDIPIGSEIEDRRDGTATLRWPTKPAHAGLHRVRVAAFDEGGGEEFGDFTIAVCSRIVRDGDLPGVAIALFESEPPAACRDADLNQDTAISAADLVQAVGRLSRAE